MMMTWSVVAHQATDGRWGAKWWTAESGPEGGPKVSGSVVPTFTAASDARGHAAMWIARYEAACAHSDTVTEDATPWQPTADELAEALAAHHARFGTGDVTIGGA